MTRARNLCIVLFALFGTLQMMVRQVFLLLPFLTGGCAWVAPQNENGLGSPSRSIDRRSILGTLATAGIASFVTPQPAIAASQEDTDKAKIVKGYKRLTYLLDNWEKETTTCKIGQTTTFGDECERTPLKVMEYLGYKSTDDPLFKVDKTLARLGNLVPADKDIEYFEAVENLLQNAEEASSMAFVSSWGEANPGGGKDRVQIFIERSKKNVIISRNSLETVMKILDIKP